MVLRGARRDDQACRDLAIGEPLRDQDGDLLLAPGQRGWVLGVGRLRRGRLASRLAALVGTHEFRERASGIADALAGEDGCAMGVAAVERFLSRRGDAR